MALQLMAIIILGLMCGSELGVAVFVHPTLDRKPLQIHIPERASLAALLGRAMPFWMATFALLNLLLLLPFSHLPRTAWRLAAIAFAIQVFAAVFSLVAPMPINNRIAKWTWESLPDDWRMQEHRWDHYHWFRTAVLIGAFAILISSLGVL